MKIWVTGANGQLGQCFKQLSESETSYQFVFTNSQQVNITDYATVKAFIAQQQPQAIINCAAYTKVDAAEQNPEICFKVNLEAVENLAQYCKQNSILLIHYSTDYVFNGQQTSPYLETDATNPLNVYAASKAAGEAAILKINPNAVIIRTSWVFSHYGHNFVKTILRLATQKTELNIVADQISCPTYALDLAVASLTILENKTKTSGTEIINYTNSGQASWYDFAKEIVHQSGMQCQVNPIPTEAYPLPAQRPQYSLLSIKKFTAKFYSPQTWQNALSRCLANLY